jgi:ATP-dependent protease ClpP protease subunit
MKKIVITAIICFSLILLLAQTSISDNELPRGIFIQLPRGVYFSNSVLYLTIQWIDYGSLTEVFNTVEMLKYEKIVIDLFSYGGSVFEAMGIVGLIEERERSGIIVEIHGRGIIASAGLIIMMSGSRGYRFIDRNAFIMFHEMAKLKYFTVESVSDEEQNAIISRKIQDSINAFIVAKTKMTREELSEKIRKKELWCTADEAVNYGFADKIMGKE